MSATDETVSVLRRGGVVACPTETWLGLLADAHDAAAIARVAALKGRPATLPIALLIPDATAVDSIAKAPLNAATRQLMAAHWPGPLTILLPAAPTLHRQLTRDGKVGVRVPGPSSALDVVRAFGGPLTATSANLSGAPPVRSVDELPEALRSGLDGVVPGMSPGGAPSTLVDATGPSIRVLRQGAVRVSPTAL